MSDKPHVHDEPPESATGSQSYRMRPSAPIQFDELLSSNPSLTGRQPGNVSANPWEPSTQPSPHVHWIVLAGIAGIVIFAAVSIYIIRLRGTDDALTVAPPKVAKVDTFDPGSAEDWTGPLPQKIADHFIKAATNAERLKWVRDPEQVAPIMESFYRDGAGASENVLGLKQMEPAFNEKFFFQRFQVRLGNGTSRLLCVVLTEDGGKVDFKAYALHCSAQWKDLLSGKVSQAAEVRVFIEPTSAYMHGFTDEKKFSSYLANSRDLDDPVFFYAPRGSKLDKSLQELTQAGMARATVAIRSVDRSHEKRQFEVTEFLVGGWCF